MIPEKMVLVHEDEADAVRVAALAQQLSGTCSAVVDYETSLRRYFGTNHALACSSGTAAIYMALRAAGVRPGDEVIVSAVGAVMTALPVLELGARPVFIDVRDASSLLLDVDDLCAVISERTKAVVAASMWGYPSVDLGIRHACEANGLVLIEDAAQAHGSRTSEGLLGTVGDIGCFSTHARKLVTTGEGGFLLTQSKSLHDRLHRLRAFGLDPDGGAFGQHHGLNFKLSGVQAALGSAQVKRLDARLVARRGVGQLWSERLADLHGVVVLARPEIHNGYGFAIQTEFRQEVEDALVGGDLATTDTARFAYTVLYNYPVFADHSRTCPHAERLVDRLVVLPCHEGVQPQHADSVAEVVQQVVAFARGRR